MKKNTNTLYLLVFLLFLLTLIPGRLAFSGNYNIYLSETTALAPAGIGTSNEPYLISSLANLRWLSENSGQWNKHFLQTADIDATETAIWNDGTGWSPVGMNWTCFTGMYDGGGFEIEGLFINRPEINNQGFFGCVQGNAVITNLGMVDVNISGNYYIGALVGRIDGKTVLNCYSSGVISANESAGGLIGYSQQTKIENSYSSGNVSGNFYIGGFIGTGGWDTEVDGCFATGNVSADYDCAGFMGMSNSAKIKNSYSHAQVTANSNGSGFIATSQNSEIVNCYSTGQVTDDYGNGRGFIQYGWSLNVSGSFWDSEASGVSTDLYAEPKTTLQMKDFSTFISKGWEFKGTGVNEVWNIGNGRNNGYPYHNWQFPDDEAPGLPHSPYFELLSVVDVVKESAEANLRLILLGDPEIVQFGACVSSSSESPTINDLIYNLTITGPGEYSIQLGDLEANTAYQVRLFAINGDDVVNYSDQLSFHTLAIDPEQPEGNGSQLNPYLISSLGELLWIRENPQHYNKFFRQTADIDASETATWNEGEGWRPIGTDNNSQFRGEFDGGNFIISGLTINRPNSNYQGLFGYINQSFGTKNIGLVNVNITGYQNVGALAGYSSSTVTNCYSTGIISGEYNVGGLIGGFYGNRMYQSYSNCDVTGFDTSGGLIGYLIYSNTIVSQCYATGSVTSNRGGGLVGRVWISKIENSYSTGNITTTGSAGGLVASLEYGEIKNSYSTGKVSGSASVGGLVQSINQGVVNTSFWDTEASEVENSATGKGHTTAEMKEINTFQANHWGFKSIGTEEIWNIGNDRNDGYPYLIWQFPTDELPSVPVMATVITQEPTNIEAGSAFLRARLHSPGNPETTEWGLIWGTNESLTMEEANKEIQLMENSEYSVEISSLESNTVYYSRAFATNEAGTILGSLISFTTLDPDDITLCQSLDNCDLHFSSGGNAPWFGQDLVTSDGEDAAQNGILQEHGQQTWFETSIEGYGEISFKWKIEASFGDTLEVLMNNQRISYIGGTKDWESMKFFTNTGSNTIRWILRKYSWSGNNTSAWIDMVTYEEIACPQPNSISFSKITDTSVKVNWAEMAVESGEWHMEWAPAGFIQGEGNMIIGLESPSHFLTSLNPGTSYDVYVRAVCDLENSRWTGPETFKTPDIYPSCDYEFVLLDSFGDGWNGATMQIIQDDVVIHTLGSGFTSGYNYHELVNLDLGVEFKVVWNYGGGWPGEVGLKILCPGGSIIYHKELIGSTNVGETIFSYTCRLHTYSLTYLTDNNGHIEGLSEQSVEYGADASAVTAVPATGYHFVEWSDGSTENPRTDENIVIDLTVTAEFVINVYTLNYQSGENGQLQGEISQTINHGSDATAVTAIPDTGYHFVKWDDESTDNPRTDVNVADHISVSAIFATNSYTVQYLCDENGQIEGEPNQTINHGSGTSAVTAIPDTGYHFVKWSDESTENPRTDVNVTEGFSVTAIFGLSVYPLTINLNIEGSGVVEGAGDYHYGDDVILKAIPADGYRFINWTCEAQNILSSEDVYSFKMIAEAYLVNANFESTVGVDQIQPFQLSVFPNPARERVTISSSSMLQEVAISDISGRIVFNKKDLNLNEFVIETNSFMPGVYFLRIVTDGKTTVRKINVVK